MANNNKLLSDMGLARRAGKLIYGYETVKIAVRSGKARMVILACDLSAKTAENIGFQCTEAKVPVVHTEFTMEQLSAAVGKPAGVTALIDSGFVKLINGSI